MEAHEIDYSSAIFFSLIGWVVRVTMYYFKYDRDDGTEKFDFQKFWGVYRQYIIAGFVASIALSFLGDVLWGFIDGWVGLEGTPYDERFNIVTGFLAILIIMLFDRKATVKSNEEGN